MTKNAVSYNSLMGYTRKYINRAKNLEALGKFDEAENLLEHAGKRIAQRNKAVINLADSLAEHGFNSPVAGAARKNKIVKEIVDGLGKPLPADEATSWLKTHPFEGLNIIKPTSTKEVVDHALAFSGDMPFTNIGRSISKANAGVFAPQLAQVREFLNPKHVKTVLDHAEGLARNGKDSFMAL